MENSDELLKPVKAQPQITFQGNTYTTEGRDLIKSLC
jgi:hypothetical protein